MFIAFALRRAALKMSDVFYPALVCGIRRCGVFRILRPHYNDGLYRLWTVAGRFCMGVSILFGLSMSRWMAGRPRRVPQQLSRAQTNKRKPPTCFQRLPAEAVPMKRGQFHALPPPGCSVVCPGCCRGPSRANGCSQACRPADAGARSPAPRQTRPAHTQAVPPSVEVHQTNSPFPYYTPPFVPGGGSLHPPVR